MTYNEYLKEKSLLNAEFNQRFTLLKKEHQQKLGILRKQMEHDRLPAVAKKVKSIASRR